jgi:hypothetical protein
LFGFPAFFCCLIIFVLSFIAISHPIFTPLLFDLIMFCLPSLAPLTFIGFFGRAVVRPAVRAALDTRNMFLLNTVESDLRHASDPYFTATALPHLDVGWLTKLMDVQYHRILRNREFSRTHSHWKSRIKLFF